jgi:hypothetical protein
MHVAIKGALITYGVLFVASGLTSYPRMWVGEVPVRVSNDVPELGKFLEQNDLTYGYGPYWGSEALMMNWMTNGKVTIRPVSFYNSPDRVRRVRGQTS